MADHDVELHHKSYVCIQVFDGSRPVLCVTHDDDGDWCFLCGEYDDDPNDADFYRVVGMNHLLENDESLHEVLDLGLSEEAERGAVGSGWVRSALTTD